MKPHDEVYARLAPSQIHGVGVIAIRDIPHGTFIFPEDNEDLTWVEKNAIADLPPEQRHLYDDFAIIHGERYGCPKSFNNLTPAWYLNNSRTPNVAADKEYRFYALRDIAQGEELTADYDTYSDKP